MSWFESWKHSPCTTTFKNEEPSLTFVPESMNDTQWLVVSFYGPRGNPNIILHCSGYKESSRKQLEMYSVTSFSLLGRAKKSTCGCILWFVHFYVVMHNILHNQSQVSHWLLAFLQTMKNVTISQTSFIADCFWLHIFVLLCISGCHVLPECWRDLSVVLTHDEL